MKIKSINVTNFGCLKDWSTSDIDSNIIVIRGDNESGKSTLFNLIKTLFYGWRPVKNNPYIPWDGSNASIEAELFNGNKELISVQRILRSRPEGRVVKGETGFDIRNNPIDMLAFMPREIFSDIYSLTLDKLRFPDSNTWQELQDQLLGGQYTSFIKPVSGVIEELEDEAIRLWRPDNRGKPEDKSLREKISKLKHKRKEARENEEELRNKERELDELNKKLYEANKKRTQLNSYLIKYERLLPVKKELDRIIRLEEQGGDIVKYKGIPDNPQNILNDAKEQMEEIDTKIARITEQIKGLNDIISAYTDEDKLIIKQSGEIRRISKSYGQIESDKEEVKTLETKLERNLDRIIDRASRFLLGGWKPELETVLNKIEEVELRLSINSFKGVFNNYIGQKSKLEGLQVQVGGTDLKFLPWVSFFAFLVGLIGNLSLGNSHLGLAFIIFGLGGLVFWFFNKGENLIKQELEKAERELFKLEKELNKRRDTVKLALNGLPVPEERLEFVDETLLIDIKDVTRLLGIKTDLQNEISMIMKRLKKRELEVNEILDSANISTSGDILEDIRGLEGFLDNAKKRQSNMENAMKDKTEIEKELKRLKLYKSELENKYNKLIEDLRSLNGETIEDKINDLLSRREDMEYAKTLRNDLEREYPDLIELEREIRKLEEEEESWDFSDSRLAEVKDERENIEDELGKLKEDIGRYETDIKHLSKQPRLDDIEGEINRLSDERKAVAMERDRLILLREFLSEANRRFREEHQPDVLQKAGYYLDIITNGRYDRLYAKDDGEGLMIRAKYIGKILNVGHPLSRGTLEQIYLALRLAFVEHLDAGREVLPLFLDEVLVNWDEMRLQNGIKLLEKIAEQRQVFLFTCHEWLVKELEGFGIDMVLLRMAQSKATQLEL